MTGARRGAVLVMAKAPRPGRVKTRLHPLLGPDGCARLQAELIRHTTSLVLSRHLAAFVAFDPPDARTELDLLVPGPVRLLPQSGANLGQRLDAAVTQVLASRPGPLLVIGTDAPTLTPAALDAALDQVVDADAVLGPALDGGYYLIGLSRPQPGLFAIDPDLWGGDQVMTATLAAARAKGLTVRQLPQLRDLDTPEDAAALLADPLLPFAIARLLTPVEAA
jgi:rSAM/selenodomain-associated transferase 1